MCANSSEFFRNLPRDAQGNEIVIRRFASMNESDLLAYRDHILSSFPLHDKPAPKGFPALRFLNKHGNEPTLTMMTMGPGADAEPSPVGRKGRSRKRDTQANRSKNEGRKSRAIIESSDESGVDDDPVPPRDPRPNREASDKARGRIANSARIDRRVEKELENEKQAKKIDFARPTGVLPGSEAARRDAAFKREAELPLRLEKHSKGVSFYLQRPGMVNSTLPDDWAKDGWDSHSVSFLHVASSFACCMLHVTHCNLRCSTHCSNNLILLYRESTL
jgi:hypothetical protein